MRSTAGVIPQDLLERIRGEYREMPCLRLTLSQAERLFGLPSHLSSAVMAALVSSRFLVQTSDERYARMGAEGAPSRLQTRPSRSAL